MACCGLALFKSASFNLFWGSDSDLANQKLHEKYILADVKKCSRIYEADSIILFTEFDSLFLLFFYLSLLLFRYKHVNFIFQVPLHVISELLWRGRFLELWGRRPPYRNRIGPMKENLLIWKEEMAGKMMDNMR